eukprot:403348390
MSQPKTDDVEQLFEVEKILSKVVQNGNQEYYEVKWFDTEETTWEPIENLSSVLHLIEEFNKNLENVEQVKAAAFISEPEAKKEASQMQQLLAKGLAEGGNYYMTVKQQLLKRSQDAKIARQSAINSTLKNNGSQLNNNAAMGAQDINMPEQFEQQIHKRKLKKSREQKFVDGSNMPHDLQTDIQIISSYNPNKQLDKKREKLTEEQLKRLDKDAAFVAQNAHNACYDKNIQTFSNQDHGVIIPTQQQTVIELDQSGKPKSLDTLLGKRSIQNIEIGNLPKNGSFETDLPSMISKARYEKGRLLLTVQWHPRPNGQVPCQEKT